MRYLYAMVVPAVLACAFIAYHLWITAKVDAIVRQVREQAGLPEEGPPMDMGIPMSSSMTTLIQIDQIILTFWVVLLPLTVLICLGIAFIFPRRRVSEEPPSASARALGSNPSHKSEGPPAG